MPQGQASPQLSDHDRRLVGRRSIGPSARCRIQLPKAGFTGAQADQAATTVFTFVLGNALGPAAAASLSRKLSRDGGNADELIHDHLAKAHQIATQFPQLRARLETAAADYGAAPENTFEFGLQAILDGLQAQLPAQDTPVDRNAYGTRTT
jgi:hypothetical protein